MNNEFMDMHRDFIQFWSRRVKHGKFIPQVLDIGSRVVNKQPRLRDLFTALPFEVRYTGVDIVSGPGVDIVHAAADPREPYVFDPATFDLIVVSSVFEHCYDPWFLMKEIHRLLRPGAYAHILTPTVARYHCAPDRWRIMKDGWVAITEEAGLILIKNEIDDRCKKWHPANVIVQKPTQ